PYVTAHFSGWQAAAVRATLTHLQLQSHYSQTQPENSWKHTTKLEHKSEWLLSSGVIT
ncbi:hypothetical protein Dsin_010678, partial [Dipteronia sinensis]